MKLTKLASHAAGVALVTATLISASAQTTTSKTQTVISNESLVSTTFAVTKKPRRAQCSGTNCTAKAVILDPFSVTCPGASGQTCTIHIFLDAKFTVDASRGFYQFLIDHAAPNVGPTSRNGNYIVQVYGALGNRQSIPASVVGTVTNSDSNTHTIVVKVGCYAIGSGCQVISHTGMLRVDVFQP